MDFVLVPSPSFSSFYDSTECRGGGVKLSVKSGSTFKTPLKGDHEN